MLPHVPIPDELSDLIIEVTEPLTRAERDERERAAASNRGYVQ